MVNKVVDIQGILNDGALAGLKQTGIPGSSIPLSGLGAVDTVAGVSPDGSKDIPVASLATALGIPAGIVTSVVGQAGPTITAAQIAAALAGAQPETWANLKTRVGAYQGEVLALPRMDGVAGGRVYVYWSATLTRWRPLGQQCLGKLAKVTGASATTFGVTIPNLVLAGGPWWPDTTLSVVTKLYASNNGSSAAPFNQSIGGNNWIADTQQPSRRKSWVRELEIYASGANGQFCGGKADNDYGPYSNQNNAGFVFSIDTTADFTLASDTGTGWVNASASTLTLQKLAAYWQES